MLYIVIIVFCMKVDLIINNNKQELMIIEELFKGPVGDYCIARNTIKCLYCILIYWTFWTGAFNPTHEVWYYQYHINSYWST